MEETQTRGVSVVAAGMIARGVAGETQTQDLSVVVSQTKEEFNSTGRRRDLGDFLTMCKENTFSDTVRANEMADFIESTGSNLYSAAGGWDAE